MEQHPLRGLRVLLVEDEVIVCVAMQQLLSEAGAKVDRSQSASGALLWLANRQYDLAVLDVSLGQENSLSVAEALDRRRVPYLVASGHSRHDIPRQLSSAPYLGKPFHPTALLRAVEKIAAAKGEVSRRRATAS